MKKYNLRESLERIHSLTYGKEKSNQLVEWIFDREEEKEEDPKKADEISDDIKELLNNLESASSTGLSQEEIGSIEYKKNVESMQIGLMLLGYDLPRHGVDGLFGPETGEAVRKYMESKDMEVPEEDMVTATPEVIATILDDLKGMNLKSDDIKQYVNQPLDVQGLEDQNFYEKLLKNLDAPVTNENLKFLYAWRQSEGKAGRFNPFNTTHGMPGSTNFNTVGVKNYRSMEDGMVATIKTLKNGRYECILRGLRDDIGASNIAKCRSLETWGTGTLVYRVIQGYEGGANPKVYKLA